MLTPYRISILHQRNRITTDLSHQTPDQEEPAGASALEDALSSQEQWREAHATSAQCG